jgi:hypothetical protein
MPRGGHRPGAGRKPGSRDKVTIDAEQKLAEATERLAAELTPEQIAAMSPLDVMLHAVKIEAMAGQWRMAAALAEKAAPYLHPKLSSEILNVRTDDGNRPTEDLAQERDAIARRRAALVGDAGTGDRAGVVAPGLPKQPPGVVH